MNKINSFLIVGGDCRQIYIADHLESLGFSVSVYGLPENNKNKISNIKTEIKNFDAVVLPLPFSKDGKYIYCVAPIKIETDEIVNNIKPEQAVFAGMISKGTETKLINKNAFIFDYFKGPLETNGLTYKEVDFLPQTGEEGTLYIIEENGKKVAYEYREVADGEYGFAFYSNWFNSVGDFYINDSIATFYLSGTALSSIGRHYFEKKFNK